MQFNDIDWNILSPILVQNYRDPDISDLVIIVPETRNS